MAYARPVCISIRTGLFENTGCFKALKADQETIVDLSLGIHGTGEQARWVSESVGDLYSRKGDFIVGSFDGFLWYRSCEPSNNVFADVNLNRFI